MEKAAYGYAGSCEPPINIKQRVQMRRAIAQAAKAIYYEPLSNAKIENGGRMVHKSV